MAVVIYFRVPGDTHALIEGYERTNAPHHPNRLAHVCARTSTGIAVTEVWSSGEDLEEFMRTGLPPIMEAAGMPQLMDGPPSWEICEVHHVALHGAAPAGSRERPADAPTA